MPLPSIFIAALNADRFRSIISSELGVSADINDASSKELVQQAYQGEEIVLGRPDFLAQLMDTAPPVRWVQSTWAGVTPLIQHAYKDYVLTGVKGIFGQQMSEYVLTHLLAHEGRLRQRWQSQQSGLWDNRVSGSLCDKTLGIMGTGSIGAAVAESCAALGVRCTGLNSSGRSHAAFQQVFAPGELTEFLQDADYVLGLLPDLPSTTGLLNARAFESMKKDALLINVGRGNLIVEDDLVQALKTQKIAGAVLDVFQQEPLPAESALWSAPDLTITGHISAVSRPDDIAGLFLQNYERYCSGQALLHIIDFDKGY
ncbi:MAG: D-2-hydroxyacid dehydrogenase [Pseudomonadota bacterium]|nr:D-2-hydroxyacid dehydrogenase [Pseudomonadota bacterium]|tara:strand:- start:994 stop:1935 length:942 start_codon:yes stop_codon:yes gene_type:complete